MSEPRPTESRPAGSAVAAPKAAERSWPLWEVFVRGKRGLSHVHVVEQPRSDFGFEDRKSGV